jgi:hypothetical protein
MPPYSPVTRQEANLLSKLSDLKTALEAIVGGMGSSTASGSGSESFSNTRGSFTATPNVGAKTITLSGFNSLLQSVTLTPANFVSGSIKRISSAGVVSSVPLTSLSYNSGTGVLMLADMSSSFAAGDTVEIVLTWPRRAYDKTNDFVRTTLASLLAGENLTSQWQRVNPNVPQQLTLEASSAKTSSGSSSTASNVGDRKEALVFLNVTAFSGTSPTLDVSLEASDDGGSTWYDIPNSSFTQRTATGKQALQLTVFGDTIRPKWTVGGTTPSFTFAVKAVLK